MRRAQPVTLNTAQCKQLDRYARGRQVAVRLALRARIVLLAAHGLENKQIAAQLGSRGSWWPAGARAFSKAASPALQKTPHGPVVHLPSRSRKYSRSSTRPPARNRPTPPTGAAAPWPPRPASALPPWDGFGAPMASSPTASRPSSSAMTRVSPRNSTTSSAYLNPPEHALVLSSRSPKSKPSIAPNPPAAQKGTRPNDDPRLQAQRHDQRQRDRRVHAPTQPPGMVALPALN